MAAVKQTIEHVETLERYKHGFVTDIDQEFAPKGLNADTVRFISAKKNEPEWMLDWRLDAFERWLAHGRAGTGRKVHFPRDRLPGQLLLRRAQEEGRARRASTRSIRSSWRPTRSSASR